LEIFLARRAACLEAGASRGSAKEVGPRASAVCKNLPGGVYNQKQLTENKLFPPESLDDENQIPHIPEPRTALARIALLF
jgi:predicted YcjX-like family ATPase